MGVFFVKQKTAYEMRISDWSSDVCSSDLCPRTPLDCGNLARPCRSDDGEPRSDIFIQAAEGAAALYLAAAGRGRPAGRRFGRLSLAHACLLRHRLRDDLSFLDPFRSAEHTSELQSLMRISSAVFCLKKKHKYR